MKKYIVALLLIVIAPSLVWADAYTLTVEGLVCDFCAQGIEKKLNKEFKDQKIQNIHVDLNDKKVTFDADKVDQAKLEELIKSAGYTLKNTDVKSAATNEIKKDVPVTVETPTKVEKK